MRRGGPGQLVVGCTASRRACRSTRGLPPAPLSPYALHKLIGEQYAALFSRLYGIETVALRFFNVFGPRQSPRSQYSGRRFGFRGGALLEGRAPTIHGDGEQTRDFTCVTDVAPRRPARLRRAGCLGAGPSTSRAADGCR